MQQTKVHGSFYLADPQDIGIFEKEWVSNLRNEIANVSTYPMNHIINITWLDIDKENELFQYIKNNEDPKTSKIWLCGSIDSCHWVRSMEFYKSFVEKGFDISLIGFSEEHWHSWFPYWLYKNNKDIHVTLSENIKHLYLSYNRKPREHRKLLVEKLIENNLLDCGYITFEHGVFPEIDNKTGMTEQGHYEKLLEKEPNNYIRGADVRYSRPEDLTTLGDLEVWNSSYLVIASESEIYDPYHLSEKTWKPILGLRPFVWNGNNSMPGVLDRLGFYTPAKLFDNKSLDKCNVDSILDLLNELRILSTEQIYHLYLHQLPMLEHNRRRFIEIATADRTKILNWAQSKKI